MSPQALPQDKKWLALALLALAQFVVVLDASIVNVALPSIGTDLEFSQDDLSWVVNGYTLFFGGFLLLGGRMADLLGRRRMFIAGLDPLRARLARRRSRQLAGHADRRPRRPGPRRRAALPGRAVARHRRCSPRAPSATRRWASGARSPAPAAPPACCSAACSPSTPAGSGCCSSTCRSAWPPRSSRRACCPRAATTGARHFDVAGAVSVTAGLSLLVYTLVDANDAGWLSGQTLGPRRRRARAARRVRRHRAALEGAARAVQHLPQAHDHRRPTSSALLVAMALFSMFFFISLYMQQVLGYSAIKSGLSYLPLAVGIIVSAGVASALVTKVGFKPVLVTGLVLTAIGLVWFSQVDVGRHVRRRHPVPVADRGGRPRASRSCR